MWQHFWWAILDAGASGRRALFFALPRQICTKTSVDGLTSGRDYARSSAGALLATNRQRDGKRIAVPAGGDCRCRPADASIFTQSVAPEHQTAPRPSILHQRRAIPFSGQLHQSLEQHVSPKPHLRNRERTFHVSPLPRTTTSRRLERWRLLLGSTPSRRPRRDAAPLGLAPVARPRPRACRRLAPRERRTTQKRVFTIPPKRVLQYVAHQR